MDYDKNVTPGDEDKISEMILKLNSINVEEQINKGELETYHEDLMENIDNVVIQQATMYEEFKKVKTKIAEELDYQKKVQQ